MKMKFFSGVFALLLAVVSAWAAPSVPFDTAQLASHWDMTLGPDAPGAQGSLQPDAANGQMTLAADFSGGGAYVGAIYKNPIPKGAESVEFTVTALQTPAQLCMRLVDATGRNFQSERFTVPADEKSLVTFPLRAPWAQVWGGDGESESLQPTLPAKELTLIVNRGEVSVQQVRIDAVRLVSKAFFQLPFTGRDLDTSFDGMEIEAKWVNGLEPRLIGEIEEVEESGYTAVLRFPQQPVAAVRRFSLEPGKTNHFEWTPPLLFGGNPWNTYEIVLELERDGLVVGRWLLPLRGAESPDWSATRNAREIENSIFGTCVHFNFAHEPRGGFKGWYPYEKLLDMIAACGIKWIRDDMNPEFRADGTAGLSAGSRVRLEAARARGIRVIAIVPTFADQPLEDLVRGAEGLARESEGLIQVFEIGNEPSNFNNWIGRFGGQWNGYEPTTNSASPWLKEHARQSNVVAERIRAIRPDAIIVGGGCVTSGNHWYLDQNFSPAFNGVTDHPYSTMLPPERVAFGAKFLKRDGVIAGDEHFSFDGIIKAYQTKFDAIGRDDLGVWLTEFGFTSYFFSGEQEKGKYTFAAYTEEAQAVYIARRFLDALTMPVIKVACQYDFMDDYEGIPGEPEARFGLVRADYSPKPSYHTVQRLTTMLSGAVPEAGAEVESAELHRAMKRGLLVDWDENGTAQIYAAQDLRAQIFRVPNEPLRLAVWSQLPYSGEFANRNGKIRVKQQAASAGKVVAVDLVTGERFDVSTYAEGEDLIVEVSLTNNPLVLTLF